MIQVENYIAGFLLKNKYCAITGLGTLELNREAAYAQSIESKIEPPTYDITFSPIGIIDDAFAAYIANHENVSISKASNDIKTFSQDVKNELRKTGRYEIDGVGHFTYKNETIQFYQDETLSLDRDPIQLHKVKNSTNAETETLADAKTFKDLNYTHAESGVGKPKLGTILKYLLSLLLITGLAIAAYFAFKKYQESSTNNALIEEAVSVEEYEEPSAQAIPTDSTQTDTTAINPADTLAAVNNNQPIVAAAAGEHKIAIQAYDNAASATTKSNKLTSYGNKTTVIQQGEKHYVVIYATHPTGDTVALKDSLRKYFNPSGTPFIVK